MLKFTNVTINLHGETFEICGTYHPSTPDVMYLPNGDPGHPGDPEELEIDRVFYCNTDITGLWDAFDMSRGQFPDIMDQVREHFRDY